MLFHAIAQGHIHLRRARLLRDMLRVAAMSCRLNKPDKDVTTSGVRDISHTPEGLPIARADASSSPGREEPGAPQAVAIASADPSQPAQTAPTPSDVAERPQPSAPELRSSGSELTSNQDFACNPLDNNILPGSPGVTGMNSGFCDFFDADHGSSWRDLGGRPTLNAGAPS
jgi:hypothetical protein